MELLNTASNLVYFEVSQAKGSKRQAATLILMG
jgi:hypothetical protein